MGAGNNHLKLEFSYDSDGDILYLFDGKPYSTLNVELDENYVLRLDPETKKLVGLMIHQFSSIYPTSRRLEDLQNAGKVFLTVFDQLHREQKLREPLIA